MDFKPGRGSKFNIAEYHVVAVSARFFKMEE